MDKRPCSQEGDMDYEEEKAHLRKKIREVLQIVLQA